MSKITLNSHQLEACELFIEYRIPALAREAEKDSTGVTGKFTEGLRCVLNVRPTDIIRCRAANKWDIRIGRNAIYEVKTGSGAVAYAEDTKLGAFTPADRIAKNVFPGVHYVIWFPFTGACSALTVSEILQINTVDKLLAAFTKLLENSWIFTRDEFIACLEYIGKHGLQSSLKLSKNGGQINIQTISHGLEARLWDVLDRTPTADTLLK